MVNRNDYYNMTICYREDSPVSSPYGYTVRLAPESWMPVEKLVNISLVRGKKKPAAWFVSHCSTNSGRERLVKRLQDYLEVDLYGSCGTKQCAKGDDCENALNSEYVERKHNA